MIRALSIVSLVAITACGSLAPPANDREACARQANDDPVVKELITRGAGNPHFQMEGQDQLRAAKQDATLACLRSRGIVAPGGVERQKPI